MEQVKQQPHLNVDHFIKRYKEGLAKIDIVTKNVTPVTPLLGELVTNFNHLYPLYNKGYEEIITPVTLVTAQNDNVQDFTLEILEERAAIIQYDAAIPDCWALAIAKIQLRSKPKSITEEKWQEIKITLEMLTTCLKDIIAHNWKISDIFGCHPTAPEQRFDVMGLLMLLNKGDRIIEVNKDVIRIQNMKGAILSYYRPYYSYLLNQRLLLHEM